MSEASAIKPEGGYCDARCLWVHCKCIGMDSPTYQTLSQSDDLWSCPKCVSPSPNNNHAPIDCIIDQAMHDDEFQRFHSKGLHFLHINMRSLLPKLDELRHIANKLNASVIGIADTWLDDTVSDSEVDITPRRRRCMCRPYYINSNISYNPCHDVGTDFESVWVELFLPKTKPILVGVCYRPPTDTNFYELLELACNNCSHFYQNECILFGDFNTDYKAINPTTPMCQHLKPFMSMFDLQQLIGEPTRVTNTTTTILDLALVSEPSNICQSGVTNLGLSDHMLTY